MGKPLKQHDRIQLQVKQRLQSAGVFDSQPILLLAVSGGVDSMVLMHAVYQVYPKMAIAHCNFQLRGQESDSDEEMVLHIAKSMGIQSFYNHFESKEFAKTNHLSIQQAARKLRYTWFEELRMQIRAEWILTAHHADDQLETFFINLSRGSGIAGLTGIPDLSQHLLRPLLTVTKTEILAYANEYQIQFRDDSSNASEKYLRNSIRLKLIPFLKDNFLGMAEASLESIDHLKQVNSYYQDKIKEELSALIEEIEDYQFVNAANLADHPHCDLILHEWLFPYGFTKDSLKKAGGLLQVHKSGYFSSSDYKLYVEKEGFYLQKAVSIDPITITVAEDEIVDVNSSVIMRIQVLKEDINYKHAPANQAYLDFYKTGCRLEIRKWKQGDSFIPLGMKHSKKISDYFIDNKFSRFKKENTYLLVAEGFIVWIVGERISDSYKIDGKTEKVLSIHVDKSLE